MCCWRSDTHLRAWCLEDSWSICLHPPEEFTDYKKERPNNLQAPGSSEEGKQEWGEWPGSNWDMPFFHLEVFSRWLYVLLVTYSKKAGLPNDYVQLKGLKYNLYWSTWCLLSVLSHQPSHLVPACVKRKGKKGFFVFLRVGRPGWQIRFVIT